MATKTAVKSQSGVKAAQTMARQKALERKSKSYKLGLGELSIFTGQLASLLQAGLPLANRLLSGQYTLGICLFLFLAKLMATSFTFGMGGVGGLFVASATIGATLGSACDILLLPSQPGLFTLVGIAAFTGASYNSLLFSAVFIAEGTGSPALMVPGLLASSVAFLVSAGVSNSQSQHPARITDSGTMGSTACRAWMSTPGSSCTRTRGW